MAKVVINVKHGGFGLSEAAYARLIELGIPVRKYIEQPRLPDGKYAKVPENEGEIIFDRDLDETPSEVDVAVRYLSRSHYWETWLDRSRTHPLLIQVVEELGNEANGPCAALKIVEIPDDVEYEIDEYDGFEHIAEKHRTWH